jgi:uncharacterized protein YoxC
MFIPYLIVILLAIALAYLAITLSKPIEHNVKNNH